MEMLYNAATSRPAMAYYFGGINAATLQILGESVDRLTEALPLLEEAGLRGEYFTPLGSITYWEEIYSQIKITNRELGLSGELGRNFERVSISAYENIIRYGGDMNDLTSAYRSFIDSYGRNMLFSAEDLENIAKLRVAFGEGFEEIFSINQMLGKSIEETSDFLEEVYEMSDGYGVNIRSTLTNIRQNLSIIDRYSFIRGSRALADMAINAERMRISIDRAVGLADELYDPENAIEIASQLQMLGGEFAKLGDPFELIFLARNEPEELQRRIATVTSGIAALNEQTGEIDIDPLGFSQLREFAQIANQDVQELAQAARQMAREGYINDLLSLDLKTRNDYDQILSKISSVAQYQDGEWSVNLGQEVKTVSQLEIADLEALESIQQGTDDSYKTLIESNRTLTDSIQILTNTLMRNLIGDELFKAADQDLKILIQNLDDQVIDSDGFQLGKELLNEMQSQTYDNFSTIAKGAIEGNLDAITGQMRENIFNPLQQASETLNNVNSNAGDVVQRLKDLIDPFTQFIQQGRDFFEKANNFFDSIDSYFSIGKGMLNFTPFGGFLSSSTLSKGINMQQMLGDNQIKPDNGGFGETNRTLLQDNIGLLGSNGVNSNINSNIGMKVDGKIQLDMGTQSTEMQIFDDPEKARQLLGMLKQELMGDIEQRIHQMGQDAKNSSNKTTSPSMLG